MVPSVFAFIVMLFGTMTSRAGLLRAQVLMCLLSGTAAINLPALGGATIVVPVMCMPFLVVRAYLESHGTGAMRYATKPVLWLSAAVLWGLLCAIFVTRMWGGDLLVISADRSGGDMVRSLLTPIHPVSGNITQSVFALGNIATFVATRYFLRFEERMMVFRDAVLQLALLNCLAAVINYAEFYAGFPSLLAYVRTAYSAFDSYEAVGTGLMRVHGTFPETSAFSAFSMGLLGFTFALWLHGVRPFWSGLAAAMLLVFLMISTSSTAYGALAIYGSMVAATFAWSAYRSGNIPRAASLMVAAILLLTFAGSLVIFESPVVDRVQQLLEITIFTKMDSASGKERGSWNAQAWENLFDTYGIGTGLGTARASSLFFVLVSNLGAVGTFCYVMFLYAVLRPPRRSSGPDVDVTIIASRHALLAALSAALLSATTFDRGIAFYLYAAGASMRFRKHAENPEWT